MCFLNICSAIQCAVRFPLRMCYLREFDGSLFNSCHPGPRPVGKGDSDPRLMTPDCPGYSYIYYRDKTCIPAIPIYNLGTRLASRPFQYIYI